jgi:hypothetical protein
MSKKTLKNKIMFCWSLQDHWQDPGPDPLVRGMDPRIRIRIRIRTKISWIRNTGTSGLKAERFCNRWCSMGWNLSWIEPRGLDGGVRGVQQIYRRVRGFGFRVRDSLGALGGYLTWAEYREGHAEAERRVLRNLIEDGKGEKGETLVIYSREWWSLLKKTGRQIFQHCEPFLPGFFFLGMNRYLWGSAFEPCTHCKWWAGENPI